MKKNNPPAAPKKRGKKKSDAGEQYERPMIDPPEEDDQPKKESKAKEEKELSVEVLKAKITNEIFLYSEYKVNNKDDKGTFKKDGENPIHDDLKHAFDALTPHLAALAEQYNTDGKLDKGHMTCRGFAIVSNGDGVVLHGTRVLSNGKPFNFNTPFYKWDTEQSESLFEEEPGDLRSVVNLCRAEVIKYLFKHKYKPEIKQESE